MSTLLNTAFAAGTAVPLTVGYIAGRLGNRRQLHEAQRVAAAAQLAARTDVLTGLTNRIGLYEELERRAAGHGPFAVLMLDLDGFKAVNDTFSHDAGDMVLSAVAAQLRDLVGPDGVAARLGGDEFVVVAAAAMPVTARTLAYAVARRVSRPIDIGGQLVTIRGSVGVVFGVPGDDVRALLHSADLAMYRAKSGAGRHGIAVYNKATGLAEVPEHRPAARLRDLTGLGEALTVVPAERSARGPRQLADLGQDLAAVTA